MNVLAVTRQLQQLGNQKVLQWKRRDTRERSKGMKRSRNGEWGAQTETISQDGKISWSQGQLITQAKDPCPQLNSANTSTSTPIDGARTAAHCRPKTLTSFSSDCVTFIRTA